MAKTDEGLQQARALAEMAEGYLSDAEFREDFEARQVRYFQAISSLLLAITKQNDIVIALLKEQTESGGLAGG